MTYNIRYKIGSTTVQYTIKKVVIIHDDNAI